MSEPRSEIDRLDRLLDDDDERRNVRCSKCNNVDASKITARLARSEAANRLLEDELRRRVQDEERHLAGHPEVAALMARIRELEQTIDRQNQRLQRRRSA